MSKHSAINRFGRSRFQEILIKVDLELNLAVR